LPCAAASARWPASSSTGSSGAAYGPIGSVGTVVINVTGAIAVGIIAGLVAAHVARPDWQIVIGTGFLGGYTTFSTTSFETVRLIQQGRYRLAIGLALSQLALALAGATGGYVVGLHL